MRTIRTAAAFAVSVTLGLSLAACASDTPDKASSSQAATGVATETSQPTTEASETPSPSASPEETTSAPATPPESKVSIDLAGNVTEFAPANTYCKGTTKSIHHVTAKAEHGLPIIEFTPNEFAMVKINEKGAPEKTNSTAGISFSGTAIIFDSAKIGNATVNGRLVCTSLQGS